MGAEEMKKRRPTHQKHIDRKLVELSTPDLFTQTPDNQARCAVATIEPGVSLDIDDQLIVAPDGDKLVARCGNSVVAKFKNPPADLLDVIQNGAGVAAGAVKKINKISRTVKVAIS